MASDDLPFRFRENKGQWDSTTRYNAWSGSSNVYFMDNALNIMHWRRGENRNHEQLNWKIEFKNCQATIPQASNPKPCNIRYIKNSRNFHLTQDYGVILYPQIYSNIDLQYYGADKRLKYDFIIHPGGNINDIQLKLHNTSSIEIKDDELHISHAWGVVKELKPYSYQIIDGKEVEVNIQYKLYNNTTYGFEILGPYDVSKNIIVDPVQLVWGTYVGSSNPLSSGYMYDIATDSDMNIYGTGYYQEGFPVTSGAFDTSFNGGDINGSRGDVFVFKLSSDGTQLKFATYLGGGRDEEGKAIHVVSQTGRVYVAGHTNSADFPVTSNAFQKLKTGSTVDGFVSCLDLEQGNLIYSTFIGGVGKDQINDLKVDNRNNVWIGGETQSTNYPTTSNALQSTYQGGPYDGFISVFDPNLSVLNYSGFFGGSNDDRIYGIATYNGTMTFTGYSSSINYPTFNAYQSSNKGGLDVILTRLETVNYSVQYSTYIGGRFDEIGQDVDCNLSGDAFFTGYTMSNDYPNTTNTVLKGLRDVIVSSISNDGQSLIYSRLVGGAKNDEGTSILVNDLDQTFVAGNSNSADFPLNKTNTADKEQQVFLLSVDYSGNFLNYSLFLGGSKDDYETPRIAFSSKKLLCEVVIGFTSHSTDLNTTDGAFQKTKLNGGDQNDQPALFKYYFGPALPFCNDLVNPADPATYKPYLNYKCQECRNDCLDAIPQSACPGPFDLKLPYRPNDTSYFQPWFYQYKGTKFSDSILTVDFKGGEEEYTITIADGCNSLDKKYKLSQPPVSVSISQSQPYLCSPVDQMVLRASVVGYKTFKWSNGSTKDTAVVSQSGVYKVIVSDGPCGEIDSAEVTIQLSGPPTLPNFGSGVYTYCFPGTYDISVLTPGDTVNTNYVWSPQMPNAGIIQVTKGGSYCVQKTNSCGTISSCITINEIRVPEVSLGKDTVLCQGQTIQLSVPNYPTPVSILWSNGSTNRSITVPPGTYWVEVRNSCGVGRDEIVVMESPNIPIVNLGVDITLCSASDFPKVLNSNVNNASVYWSTGETTPSITIQKGGTYIATAINGCGQNSDTINIISNPALTLELGPDIRVCGPANIPLNTGDFGKGTTYQWSNGSTSRNIVVNSSGTYNVTVQNVCGSVTDQIKITIDNGLPIFSLGADEFICPGNTKSLNGPSGLISYLWNSGNTLSSEVAGPGLHWLQVTNSCGIYRDTIVLTTQPALYTNLPADTSICFPALLFLKVPVQNAQYLWSTGSTQPNILVTQSGTYSIRLSNNCETIQSSVNVQYTNEAPTVSLGPDLVRCGSVSETLTPTVTDVFRYNWNTGVATSSITVQQPGYYSVLVSNGCGSAYDSILIISDPVIAPINTISLCSTSAKEIDAGNPGATYLWNPTGSTSQKIIVSTSGQYSVDISNACGSASGLFDISLESTRPIFDLGPNLRICAPDTRTIGQTLPGVSYLWNNGAVTPEIDIQNEGTYTLSITNGCGTSKDSIRLYVDFGAPVVELGNDRTFCNPFGLSLDAGSTGATYTWTGSNQKSRYLNIFQEGTYEVLVTNACGNNTDKISIASFNHPLVSIEDSANCNTPITFDVTSSGALGYNWLPTNEATSSITVTESGTYYVEVTHPCGIFSDSAKVIINKGLANVSLGKDTLLCTPAGLTLTTPDYEGGTFIWLPNNSTEYSILVKQAGQYILKVENYCGINSDTVLIDANPVTLNARPDTTVCPGTEVALYTAEQAATLYEWYNVSGSTLLASNDSVWVNPTYPFTDYIVKGIQNQCYNFDTLRVNVHNFPGPKIGVSAIDGYIPLDVQFTDVNKSGINYKWTFDDGGSAFVQNPAHTFREERYYQIYVTTDNGLGCTGKDSIKILAFDLFIPNLLTPNGDGMNDSWDLTDLNPYLYVEIVNIWGDIVYQKDGYVDEWRGNNLPQGVYYYVVKDVKYQKVFKGWVHLVK
ncbi:MAG: gliding motility-associated C-terminal domain-containing protein [Cytophagaceae bacterium]